MRTMKTPHPASLRSVSGLGALLALIIALLAPDPAWAEVQISGNIRPRAEARSFEEGAGLEFSSMRTRVNVQAPINAHARFFGQFQDTRLFGEEVSTQDGSADQFDLHQGFFELGVEGRSPLWLRIGRQEMEIAEGRLIGIPVWSQVGRSFDGIRAATPLGGWGTAHAFAFQVQEESSQLQTRDGELWGGWIDVPMEDHRIHAYLIQDDQSREATTERRTIGTHAEGQVGRFGYRVEAAWQGGEVLGEELSANFLGVWARVPSGLADGDVTLWYDRYSGSAEPGPGGEFTSAFSDLYGRNHRILGFADLFANIESDTRGRGLQDLALRFGWPALDGGRIGLDVHRFVVTDDAGLADAHLADEVDLRFNLPTMEGIQMIAGVSQVWAGDGGRALGVVAVDQSFAYLMLTASF